MSDSPIYTIPQDLVDSISPLIDACGVSTLSRFRYFEIYTQAKNRYYFLRDVHDFASDTGCLNFDQSITLEKEIDYVNGVLSQLDIYNTIDHPVSKQLSSDWRKYYTNNTIKKARSFYGFHRKPALRDDAYKMLEVSTYSSRHAFTVQRLHNAMKVAHDEGWYMVFDTLTLDNSRLDKFYHDENALRDYFRTCSREVLKSLGMKVNQSSSDVYQYFCVPEYGTQNGRLHFHAIHLLKSLPSSVKDPNYGLSVPNRLQIPLFSRLWKYGNSMPIAVRYHNDAFTRLGWRWPCEPAKIRGKVNPRAGEPKKCVHYEALAYYVSKYVSKSIETKKLVSVKECSKWQETLKQQLQVLPRKLFRVRMSRNFGMRLPDMTYLSNESLVEMMTLDYSVTRFTMIVRSQAKKTLKSRLAVLNIADIQEMRPVRVNLLKHLRDLMQMTKGRNSRNSIDIMTPRLTLGDISDETSTYIAQAQIGPQVRRKSEFCKPK